MARAGMKTKSQVQLLDELRVVVPTITNTTIELPDTEYARGLPKDTKALQFQCRTANALRYAWASGVVASPAPTDPYFTLKSGDIWYNDHLTLTSATLHVAAAASGLVLEVEAWTV